MIIRARLDIDEARLFEAVSEHYERMPGRLKLKPGTLARSALVLGLEQIAKELGVKRPDPVPAPAPEERQHATDRDVVRLVHELADKGNGPAAIVRALTDHGYRPARAAKWTISSVKSILARPIEPLDMGKDKPPGKASKPGKRR